VADAAWGSTPAQHGGFSYFTTILLTNGQTIKLGFYVGRESAPYVADRLREAIRDAKRRQGI
jgi:hypothetical protein